MPESLSPQSLATVPDSEISCLLDYARARFHKLSRLESWRETRTLSKADEMLLMAITAWIRLPRFLKASLDDGMFNTIAELQEMSLASL